MLIDCCVKDSWWFVVLFSKTLNAKEKKKPRTIFEIRKWNWSLTSEKDELNKKMANCRAVSHVFFFEEKSQNRFTLKIVTDFRLINDKCSKLSLSLSSFSWWSRFSPSTSFTRALTINERTKVFNSRWSTTLFHSPEFFLLEKDQLLHRYRYLMREKKQMGKHCRKNSQITNLFPSVFVMLFRRRFS